MRCVNDHGLYNHLPIVTASRMNTSPLSFRIWCRVLGGVKIRSLAPHTAPSHPLPQPPLGNHQSFSPENLKSDTLQLCCIQHTVLGSIGRTPIDAEKKHHTTKWNGFKRINKIKQEKRIPSFSRKKRRADSRHS